MQYFYLPIQLPSYQEMSLLEDLLLHLNKLTHLSVLLHNYKIHLHLK